MRDLPTALTLPKFSALVHSAAANGDQHAAAMKISVALLLSVCWSTGFAGLGGTPASLGAAANSSRHPTASSLSTGYSDLAKKLDSGTEIHQYVNAAGVVFAVSWTGPYLPDLQELLGTHFQTLVEHARRRVPGARSQAAVQQRDLVIVSGGRMGAFEGKAWLPDLLPAAFNTSDIR